MELKLGVTRYNVIYKQGNSVIENRQCNETAKTLAKVFCDDYAEWQNKRSKKIFDLEKCIDFGDSNTEMSLAITYYKKPSLDQALVRVAYNFDKTKAAIIVSDIKDIDTNKIGSVNFNFETSEDGTILDVFGLEMTTNEKSMELVTKEIIRLINLKLKNENLEIEIVANNEEDMVNIALLQAMATNLGADEQKMVDEDRALRKRMDSFKDEYLAK